MNKHLPIGIEDYVDAQRYYYVDKTAFIKELIDGYVGKSMLIIRPRFFGKTLLLSMVDHFFDIDKSSEAVFEGKAVFRDDARYRDYLNAFPTVHLNMKNVNGHGAEEIIAKAKAVVVDAYRAHSYLLRSSSIYENDRNTFEDILNGRELPDYVYHAAVLKLCAMLSAHFGKRVVLLIDEYDTPLQSAYENGIYDRCIPFFKELYSSALKGNPSLLFAICTGVLEISKESLFSGLNSLERCSVADGAFATDLGFTEAEVRELLGTFGMGDRFEEAKRWYGGYRIGEAEVFNPWSMLHFVKNGTVGPYWVNTGSNALLDTLLSEGKREGLLNLLNGPSSIELNLSINYRDLDSDPSAVYSYLVHAGYLRIRAIDGRACIVDTVNEEIFEMFKRDIVGRTVEKDALAIADRLRDAFLSGDTDEIGAILETYVVASYSYFDLGREKDYQNMLTGLLAVLFDRYVVKSEVNGKNGRCDIMVCPKSPDGIGMVVEVKHYGYVLSRNKIREKALEAIRQIERRGYEGELRRLGCRTILLYGFAFDSKKHAVEGKAIGSVSAA